MMSRHSVLVDSHRSLVVHPTQMTDLKVTILSVDVRWVNSLIDGQFLYLMLANIKAVMK